MDLLWRCTGATAFFQSVPKCARAAPDHFYVRNGRDPGHRCYGNVSRFPEEEKVKNLHIILMNI